MFWRYIHIWHWFCYGEALTHNLWHFSLRRFLYNFANFPSILYTEYTQKNCAVSKVNKKFISHPTRAQRTPSAAASVHVSHALQQFASHAYCGAPGPVSKMASQQEKNYCVLCFEVSRSVITLQPEFRARFRKDSPRRCVFSKPCTKLTLNSHHWSGHLKTEHTESLFLLRRYLGNWPRSPTVSMRNEMLVTLLIWTVAAADGVSCARVRWEINFLLTLETVPFLCVYPVLPSMKCRTVVAI